MAETAADQLRELRQSYQLLKDAGADHSVRNRICHHKSNKLLFCVLLERLGLIALLERGSMSATFESGESIHRQSHF